MWHPDMWIPPAISDETAKKQARGARTKCVDSSGLLILGFSVGDVKLDYTIVEGAKLGFFL